MSDEHFSALHTESPWKEGEHRSRLTEFGRTSKVLRFADIGVSGIGLEAVPSYTNGLLTSVWNILRRFWPASFSTSILNTQSNRESISNVI